MTATKDFDRRLGDWLEEGAQTVPDWLVEQALGQAHATPQVGAGIRWPWHAHSVRGLRLAVALVLVLATLVAIAIAVGSNRRPEEPARLVVPGSDGCFPPVPAASTLNIQDPVVVPRSDVRVHLPPMRQLSSTAQAMPGAVGLGDGVPGLSYGMESDDDGVYVATAARGIVVADVTGARSHGPLSGVVLGDTPEKFVAGLRDQSGFAVANPAAVLFADLPAVVADVQSDAAGRWSHIDRRTSDGDLSCVVDFALPSRVTVVNVDGAPVLVQVWAATPERLRAWLPVAETLLQRVRITRS